MSVQSLAYVRLQSDDQDGWRQFATEILGMMPIADDDEGAARWRIDKYPARLVVGAGPENRMLAAGFEVANERRLNAAAERLCELGFEVVGGDEDACARRGVTAFVSFVEPGGMTVELCCGPVLDHVPVQTPLVSRFVTGDMGMGHIVVTSSEPNATYELFVNELGFFERNLMDTQIGPMWFLGPNRRHHSLGLVGMEGPSRLLHFMVEAAAIDDVGYALDRVHRAKTPLQQTLGRHTNDHMISFYAFAPDGTAVEFGTGGIPVDGEQPTYAITAPSFWGHEYLGPLPPASDNS